MRLLSFFVALIFISINLHAVEPESFQIDTLENGAESRYVMNGKRFHREGAPPVVLAHGFLNNDVSLEIWAEYLYKAGYDVWVFNHLGFGLNGRISYSKNYQPGDYGFINLLNGMDQVIRHVKKVSGQKITYMSFSMGGMTFYQYVAGTYGEDKNGIPLRDQKLAQERQNMFAKSVTIGAPNFDLKGLGIHLQMLGKYGSKLFNGPLKNLHTFVPLGLGKETNKLSSAGGLVGLAQKFLSTEIMTHVMADVMHLPNMGPYKNNLNEVLNYKFSNPHTDILRSFANMIANRHALPAPEMHIPNLALIGSLDRLAPARQLLRQQTELMKQDLSLHHSIVLGGYGHLDLINRAAIDLVGSDVLEFLHNTENFDKKYQALTIKGLNGANEQQLYTQFEAKALRSAKDPDLLEKFKQRLTSRTSLRCSLLF